MKLCISSLGGVLCFSALAIGLTTTSVNAVTIIDNFDSTITNNANAANIE